MMQHDLQFLVLANFIYRLATIHVNSLCQPATDLEKYMDALHGKIDQVAGMVKTLQEMLENAVATRFLP